MSATPTFLINGRMKTGAPSVEEFSEIIDEELEKAT
ncbi:MAG: DsbA family protein [Desulfococcaceae bacterium]